MKRSGRLTDGLKSGFLGMDSCGNESAELGVAGADDGGENKSLLFRILRTAFLRSGVGVHGADSDVGVVETTNDSDFIFFGLGFGFVFC